MVEVFFFLLVTGVKLLFLMGANEEFMYLPADVRILCPIDLLYIESREYEPIYKYHNISDHSFV